MLSHPCCQSCCSASNSISYISPGHTSPSCSLLAPRSNVIQDLLSDVRASGITLSGLPASASPYYKAAAAAAEGWGSAGSVGAAPASGWMQSSSWAASLLVSSSGGSSGSDDDHVSTDYAGYADDDSAGGGVPDTISLEAALDAARNTLAAHYLPKVGVQGDVWRGAEAGKQGRRKGAIWESEA